MAALAQLPQEVWLLVLSFLEPKDRAHIRASCQFFRRLADHPCLWRKHTVLLKEGRSFNRGLWRTLRRRRPGAIVIQKATIRALESMSTQLPWLASLTIEQCSDSKVLYNLPRFKNLAELVMVGVPCPPGLADLMASLVRLTNLCLCSLKGDPRAVLLHAAPHLTNLMTLRYHQSDHPLNKRALNTLLSNLPNLKCLSLKMGKLHGTLPDDYFTLPRVNGDRSAGQQGKCEPVLTRLELLHYMDPILSPVALDHLSSLESLTVFYRQRSVEAHECNLNKWLHKLPCLSELTVMNGYSLGAYVHSVPAMLRTLCLQNVVFGPADLSAIGKRAPGIQHLSVDRRICDGQRSLQEVPVLFHQLRTLQMSYLDMAELDFGSLAQLQHLDQLVILDSHPSCRADLLDQIHKFKCLTDYRVQVVHSERRRDPFICYCCL
ncbi:uncharacterized protein LOC108941463 isoform X2 [Scleropages formosus]|uniref:uncharacterized protein LOC108941463 isoform X2 n=1 Tax=Scleropages formosus TaxID=113540 RepID=UPI000878693B|nr:uncharacterized protein LOC108941463 isoform X2 [Scleropages formosus]